VLSWPRLDADVQSAFSSKASRLLASGDRRFGSNPDDGAIYRSFTELKSYLTPLLEDSAIEIAIVGDVDEEPAIAAVAKTFGALPMRRAAPSFFKSARPVRFRAAGDPIRVTHTGDVDQAQVSLLWHVDIDPDANPRAARVLSVLASVMRLKILATVREELGASYAPAASSVVSGAYPGLAYVVAGSEVKPEDADRVIEALRSAAAELRDGRISEDEFSRALSPSLEQLPLHASSNGYWLSLISQAQSLPEKMERSKLAAVEASIKAITIADLVAAANRWLRDADGLEVWVTPSERGDSPPKR
jgi:zinc protease